MELRGEMEERSLYRQSVVQGSEPDLRAGGVGHFWSWYLGIGQPYELLSKASTADDAFS